jgi:hypothetical protein
VAIWYMLSVKKVTARVENPCTGLAAFETDDARSKYISGWRAMILCSSIFGFVLAGFDDSSRGQVGG